MVLTDPPKDKISKELVLTPSNSKSSTSSFNSKGKSKENDNKGKGSNTKNKSSSSSSSALKSTIPDAPSHPGKDGKLTEEEHQQCIKEKLCMFCGQPGHMAKDCPKFTSKSAKTKARVAKVKTPTVAESKNIISDSRALHRLEVALTPTVHHRS